MLFVLLCRTVGTYDGAVKPRVLRYVHDPIEKRRAWPETHRMTVWRPKHSISFRWLIRTQFI